MFSFLFVKLVGLLLTYFNGFVRLNSVEAGRATLQPRLISKHSPFRYMYPGPGFLDHLAEARGPGTKSLGTIVYRAATQVLPIALPWFNYLRCRLSLQK